MLRVQRRECEIVRVGRRVEEFRESEESGDERRRESEYFSRGGGVVTGATVHTQRERREETYHFGKSDRPAREVLGDGY